MKKYLSFSNILFTALLGFLLYQRLPTVLKNFQAEGSKLYPISLPDKNGKLVNLVGERRRVLIFWATWCVPCKIELSRYKAAVQDLQISSDAIYAVNIGEPAEKVFEHASKNQYPFVVLADVDEVATRFFEISMTPTVVFLEENGVVNRVSSGLSVMPVSLAKTFFAESNP